MDLFKNQPKALRKKTSLGPIYESVKASLKGGRSGAMFLRQEVGNAEHEDGSKYTMTANLGNAAMIVESHKTGRSFIVSWKALIDFARENGIDDPKLKFDAPEKGDEDDGT